MSRLGRILGRRGQRAADDHDTTTTADPTAAHPAADPGERPTGLWESGSHDERAGDDASASAAEPAPGAPAGSLRESPQRDGAQPGPAGEPSPASDSGERPAAVPHADHADVGSHSTGSTGGHVRAAPPEPGTGEPVATVIETEPTVVEPAGVAVDTDASPSGFGIRPRSRMRRRLRYLRRARELQLRDLGGFVYEQARTAGGDHGRQEQLLNEKVRRVRAIDEEIGALATTLGAPARRLAIREPGVGGTCPTCGELHPSDARFCSNCGTRVDVRGSSGGAQGSVLAAWTNPDSQPDPVSEQPAPAGWGAVAASVEPTHAPVAGHDEPGRDVPASDAGARSLRALDEHSGAEGRDEAVAGAGDAAAHAAGGVGAVQVGEPADPADPLDPADRGDPRDPADPRDLADPIDPADPPGSADPRDPADLRDPADPADPVDREAPTRIQPIVTNHQEPR